MLKAKRKIYLKKSLGQNFLKDKKVLQAIIQASVIKKEDKVLEIGPGEGFLTKGLLEKGAQVLAIEKDNRLVEFLMKRFINQKFEVIQGDILKVNLPQFLKEKKIENYKIVANIPYYLTGSFFRLIFETSGLILPDLMVLMLQKEVAERICAPKGKKSLLSIILQIFSEVSLICFVPKESFFPSPKVDSAVIKVIPKKRSFEDKLILSKIIWLAKMGFSQKRKKLLNNLKNLEQFKNKDLRKIFKEIGLNENVRAQELEIKEWQKLAQWLF